MAGSENNKKLKREKKLSQATETEILLWMLQRKVNAQVFPVKKEKRNENLSKNFRNKSFQTNRMKTLGESSRFDFPTRTEKQKGFQEEC